MVEIRQSIAGSLIFITFVGWMAGMASGDLGYGNIQNDLIESSDFYNENPFGRELSSFIFTASSGPLISPNLFGVGGAFLITLVLLTSDLTVAGSSVKGIAMAMFGGWVFLYFTTLSLPPGMNLAFAFIIVPMYVNVGVELMEIAKQ